MESQLHQHALRLQDMKDVVVRASVMYEDSFRQTVFTKNRAKL